ncbi:MAG: hypothetical protein QM758_11910 [Armatimonas sp.]
MTRTLSLLTLCAIAAAAHAQQGEVKNAEPRIFEPAQIQGKLRTLGPGQARAFGLGQGRTLMTPTAPAMVQVAPRPAWLDKEINLSFRNEKPMDAAKLVLKAAGRAVETVEVDKDLPAPQISLTVKNVQVGDALAAIGRLANAIAYVSEKDDKVTVSFRKRTNAPATQVWTTFSKNVPADMQKEINRAMEQSRTSITTAQPFVNAYTLAARLPDKRVSLDVRNTDAREILKNLLKQADVDFMLEEDVPEKKFSFTFENVSLRYALDAVCSSMEVGWSVQPGGGDKGAKATVRVGKKWTRRSTGSSNLFGYGFDSNGFNTFHAFPTYPTEGPLNLLPEIAMPDTNNITVNGIIKEIEILDSENQTKP